MKKILVIGSLNMDLVTHVTHLPKAGETITSHKFQTNTGGKGANQAVASSMLGGNVSMIGKVGRDEYGKALMDALNHAGVNTRGIIREEGATGLAFINVSRKGENNIVLVLGVNRLLGKSDIDQLKNIVLASDLIIMQLEIPLETVTYVLAMAKEYQIKVIFNPAPAIKLDKEIYRNLDTIIPNETELEILTDMPVSNEKELLLAGNYLKSQGVKRVIITVGKNGSYVINDHGECHIESQKVKAVDTTAAGDSFVAAFANAHLSGMNDIDAVRFASKVAGIVVTREGSQQSLPSMEEVLAYDFGEDLL